MHRAIAAVFDPAYSPAWVNLGTAHLALGDLPQAEAAYSKGVAANPGYPVAHYHLGAAHEHLGDLPAAEKNYGD